MALVEVQKLPDHVAIIMDGNGRWATEHGKPRPVGHRSGSDAVRRTVRACRRLGIRALTLYAFSEQNWQRPSVEVHLLMELLEQFLHSERDEVRNNNIRFRAIGRVQRLPESLRALIRSLEEETQHANAMTLSIAVSYGGHEEIADAAVQLAQEVKGNRLQPEQIDVKMFEQMLPSMKVGPVDLLIRTGGEQRISNFLLWGAAYAELFFSSVYWPEFSEQDLFEAIAAYQHRERRYGMLKPLAAETEFTSALTEVEASSPERGLR